jgi:VWFA-related protein
LNAAHGARHEDLLSGLTSYTGGRQFTLGNRRALEQAVTQIGEEIHGQYLLSYTPRSTHDGGFHRIRVVSKRAGLEVRSRPGYWPSN